MVVRRFRWFHHRLISFEPPARMILRVIRCEKRPGGKAMDSRRVFDSAVPILCANVPARTPGRAGMWRDSWVSGQIPGNGAGFPFSGADSRSSGPDSRSSGLDSCSSGLDSRFSGADEREWRREEWCDGWIPDFLAWIPVLSAQIPVLLVRMNGNGGGRNVVELGWWGVEWVRRQPVTEGFLPGAIWLVSEENMLTRLVFIGACLFADGDFHCSAA